jgi:hypothetical protein
MVMDPDKLNSLALNNKKILLHDKVIDFRFTDYLESEGVRLGWFGLVHDFLLEASKTRKVNIAQIKEKFGRLTIYITGTKKQYDIAQKYEKASANVCDQCGKPGSLTDKSHGYWMLTLCDEHKKQYKEDRLRRGL